MKIKASLFSFLIYKLEHLAVCILTIQVLRCDTYFEIATKLYTIIKLYINRDLTRDYDTSNENHLSHWMLHVRKIRHPTRFTDISGARCKVLTDSAREQIVEVPRCEKPVTQLLCSYIQLNGTNFPFFIFSTSQCPYERQPKKWIISASLGLPGKSLSRQSLCGWGLRLSGRGNQPVYVLLILKYICGDCKS